jgi:hypothetical protein
MLHTLGMLQRSWIDEVMGCYDFLLLLNIIHPTVIALVLCSCNQNVFHLD